MHRIARSGPITAGQTRTGFGVRLGSVLLVLALPGCLEDAAERGSVESVDQVRELPATSRMGADEGGVALGLISRLQDAFLVGDEVVVVDSDPPWIRVFDRQGTLQRTLVPAGEGPGESGRVIAAASAAGTELVLTTHRRIHFLRHDGDPARATISPPAFLLRWAGEACGSAPVALGIELGSEEPRGLLMRMGDDGALTDTILTLGPLRDSPNARFPPYVWASESGLLLYTEERDIHRLVEVDCAGELIRSIPVEPLGLPERFESGPAGIGLHPPEPPFPAGLARVQEEVIWAVQVERPGRGGSAADSVTVLRSLSAGASVRTVELAGWFLLLDADADGTLLLGRREPVSELFLVPTDRLFR